jgi:hypothetical protein
MSEETKNLLTEAELEAMKASHLKSLQEQEQKNMSDAVKTFVETKLSGKSENDLGGRSLDTKSENKPDGKDLGGRKL